MDRQAFRDAVSEPSPSSAPFILLIDDMAAELELISAACAMEGIQARWHLCDQVLEVIPFLLALPRLPDLLIVDMRMPRMSGLEFLRLMRSTPALTNLPTIILSMMIRPAEARACEGLGVLGIFKKPITLGGHHDLFGWIALFLKNGSLPQAEEASRNAMDSP